jgi:hypothetical protein
MISKALVVIAQVPAQEVPGNQQAATEIRSHLEPLAAAEIALTEAAITQSPEDDRQAVAARVRNLLAQANITEKRIRIGVEYRARRNQLRRSGRHDDGRTGWYAEFAKPNPHPFSRRGAERHIDFGEAFENVGQVWPKLPHAFGALHLLATFKLSDAELKAKCLSNEISLTSTEGQIWKVGAALGKVETKPGTKKRKKKTHVPVLSKRDFDRMSLEDQQKFLDEIGPDNLRKSMSAKLCAALQKRYETQLALTNPRIAAVLKIAPTATVLPMPSHVDLVSTFDTAPAEERARFARERGEQVVDAA